MSTVKQSKNEADIKVPEGIDRAKLIAALQEAKKMREEGKAPKTEIIRIRLHAPD